MASEFETGQSQRDVRLVIPAGGTVNPNYRGEFVFVKDAARAVVVTIHEQEIEMESGDIRRVTSPFDKFSIRNDGAVSAEVRLVVGFGNYNRLIVQGEMNVSAYVRSSGNGVSAAPPDEITKEVGLDNTNEVTVGKGGTITSYAEASANAVFFWDDEFYGVIDDTLYQLDQVNDGVVAGSVALSAVLPGVVKGAAINTRGQIFVHTAQGIYRLGLDGTVFGQVLSMPTFNNNIEVYGGGSLGDKVYFMHTQTANRYTMVEYDTVTGDFRRIEDAVDFLPSVVIVYGGKLYRKNNGSGDHHEVDINSLELTGVVRSDFGGGGFDAAYSPLDDIYASGLNSGFSIKHIHDATIYGRIWVQEVGDITTRRYLSLLDEYVWYPRNGKTVMVGKVLKAILAATERSYDEDYLDRIVSIKYSDGLNTHLLSSGTQSWALRGLEDELHLALDSEITIEILPPF